MSDRTTRTAKPGSSRALVALAGVLVALAAAPLPARAGTYGERLVTEGDDFFHAGNFFRASESYRCAVLEEPQDGMKKLAFGQSLFALGNYAYASYSFRRGMKYLRYPADLAVDVAALFPSRPSYERALRDVRRYASYYPNDPHALTVIAYAAYFGGARAETESACKRLLALDSRDEFAAYFLRRVEVDATGSATTPMPPPETTVVASQPQPCVPGLLQPITPIAASGIAAAPATRRASAEGIAPRTPPVAGAPSGARPVVAGLEPRAPSRGWEKPEAPLELPPGERSGPAETLSDGDDLAPALAK